MERKEKRKRGGEIEEGRENEEEGKMKREGREGESEKKGENEEGGKMKRGK